jgi:hypothetical protein
MSVIDDPTRQKSPIGPSRKGARPPSGLFRAFWRWHFYASVVAVPVLLVLAVTGLVYLFRFQIEPFLHADLMRVDHAQGQLTSPGRPSSMPCTVPTPVPPSSPSPNRTAPTKAPGSPSRPPRG